MLGYIQPMTIAAWCFVAAISPDPAPGSASGWMQAFLAVIGLLTLLATCLKMWLDMRHARQQREWLEEDRRRAEVDRQRHADEVKRELKVETKKVKTAADRVERKTDVQTQLLAEVVRNGSGAPKPKLDALLKRYDELNNWTPNAGPSGTEAADRRDG